LRLNRIQFRKKIRTHYTLFQVLSWKSISVIFFIKTIVFFYIFKRLFYYTNYKKKQKTKNKRQKKHETFNQKTTPWNYLGKRRTKSSELHFVLSKRLNLFCVWIFRTKLSRGSPNIIELVWHVDSYSWRTIMACTCSSCDISTCFENCPHCEKRVSERYEK